MIKALYRHIRGTFHVGSYIAQTGRIGQRDIFIFHYERRRKIYIVVINIWGPVMYTYVQDKSKY